MKKPMNRFLWHYKVLKIEGLSLEESFKRTYMMIKDLGGKEDLRIVLKAYHDDIQKKVMG